MKSDDFKIIRRQFVLGDLERKIEIYTKQQGLSLSQYKELLRVYPPDKWERLEKAVESI